MNKKLILAVLAVVVLAVLNLVALYVVFLILSLPEMFMFVLAFYTTILVIGMGLALAWSQEENAKRDTPDSESVENQIRRRKTVRCSI